VAAAHLILFSPLPLLLRTLAALVIVAIAPAALMVRAWLPHTGGFRAALERGVTIAALAFVALTIGMLLLSYLPGGLVRWQVLLFYDVAIAGLLALLWWRRDEPGPITPPDRADRRWLIAGAIVLGVAGSLLRFTNLGYAEFHGDEARAVLRASAVIQGHEEALLIHRKGPVEILVPAAGLVLTGQIDEASARLPFALAGVAALFALWALGWRLLSVQAGWIAALLMAVGGYFVAFGRFVQYQSVVVLTTSVALLMVAALLQTRGWPRRRLLIASLCFATGLLAHYDALAALPPLLFLLGVLLHAETGIVRRARLLDLVVALAAGLAALAIYYVPFIRNPAFQATLAYLLGERIGGAGGPPYNNLPDLFVRGALYNSAYFMGLLAMLLLVALGQRFWRGYGRRWGTLLLAATLALAAYLLLDGGGQSLEAARWMVAAAALLLMLAAVAPRQSVGQRTLWIWFAAAAVATLFLTAFPRTHVYVFFAPWLLIAGGVLATGWQWSSLRLSHSGKMWLAGAASGAAVLIFGGYTFLLYVTHTPEVLRTWPVSQPAFYWRPAGVEAVDGRFGFPFTNGWKVVGALYAQGEIAGDYETNQRYMWIPDWYTRGQHRCGSTADWYFAVNSLEPWMEDQRQIADRLGADGYHVWGQVTVAGEERMTIYRRGGEPPAAVRSFALEAYAPVFDALASANLPLRYPVVLETPASPLHATFGEAIQLEGYDLRAEQPLAPGDHFQLKLFWRKIGPSDQSLKVSVQSYYGDGVMVAQKDALPVCDREPTPTWDRGELIVDIHDVATAADAPPGLYPLYVALYDAASGERLPVVSELPVVNGNQLQLGAIEIGAP
jgi:4-amino-4-deoxy-L-arabinose transferase-like glycosyltransferase